MKDEIFVPKLGVNDDELLISEIHISNLEYVEKGRLLFVVESMKTSEDIYSTTNGFVSFDIKTEQYVRVGSLLCCIYESLEDAKNNKIDFMNDVNRLDNIVITSKAKILLKKNNIDPKLLGLDLIKESDVISYLEKIKPVSDKYDFDSLDFQNNSIVLIGASSFASSIISTINRLSSFSIIGLLVSVDDRTRVGQTYNGITIIGTDDTTTLTQLYAHGLRNIFLAYGGFFSLSNRIKNSIDVISIGYKLPVIIHPNAVIGDYVEIGDGTYIGPLANIGNNVTIGNSAIVLDSVVVAHDSQIGDNVYLSPGCILAGGVKIGNSTIIGMGVTVYMKVIIGNNVVVNNGISVFDNINSNTLVKK